MTPILMLGAGRMGGAMITGWLRAGAVAASDLIIRDPFPGEAVADWVSAGAKLNPTDQLLAQAQTVVLAVKPQTWRDCAAEVSHALAPDAVIISIAAGVACADISAAFAGRSVARVMPTTAAAIGRGVASIYAPDLKARTRARDLFAPLGTVVGLDDEALMHAATGTSGSAPAYFYALVEALQAAGVSAGLPEAAARDLARATMIGAAALMADSGEDPAELRRQVTSPNGTTEAALKVLMGPGGLPPLLRDAVSAAARRSEELAG